MPAFSFEKLSPPPRRDSSSAEPSPATPSSTNPSSHNLATATPSPADPFDKMDYLCATRTRHERGFVLQMITRLTRVRTGG
jgi:hypothetical protein